jgi:hypothetical protein
LACRGRWCDAIPARLAIPVCSRRPRATRASAYVSIRQHTSACVSIRQHASAYVSIRQHTSAYVSIRHLQKAESHSRMLACTCCRLPAASSCSFSAASTPCCSCCSLPSAPPFVCSTSPRVLPGNQLLKLNLQLLKLNLLALRALLALLAGRVAAGCWWLWLEHAGMPRCVCAEK